MVNSSRTQTERFEMLGVILFAIEKCHSNVRTTSTNGDLSSIGSEMFLTAANVT